MKRHYRPDSSHPFRINVTPKEAEWRYLSFWVLALEQGQIQHFDTGDSEMVVVPLSGEGVCAFRNEEFIFSRSSVFEELSDIYYLNFLAGDVRKITAVNDPNYDWVGQNWSGNPIAIPVKS